MTLEGVFSELKAALGVPALVLIASAFIVVEFGDAAAKLAMASTLGAYAGLALFALGTFLAVVFVLRTRYRLDVRGGLIEGFIAALAAAVTGAFTYCTHITAPDTYLDAAARVILFVVPIGVCYGLLLSLWNYPTEPDAQPLPPVRARIATVAVLTLLIVLPVAAGGVRLAEQWDVEPMDVGDVLGMIMTFHVAKAGATFWRDRRRAIGSIRRLAAMAFLLMLPLFPLLILLKGLDPLLGAWLAVNIFVPRFHLWQTTPHAIAILAASIGWSSLAYLFAVADPPPIARVFLANRQAAPGRESFMARTAITGLVLIFAFIPVVTYRVKHAGWLAFRVETLTAPAVDIARDTAAAELAIAAGRKQAARAAYADADRSFTNAVSQLRHVVAIDPRSAHEKLLAGSLHNLGLLRRDEGRYDDAATALIESATLRSGYQVSDPLPFAAALSSLARIFANQGRYGDSEALFRRAVKIRESALGPRLPAQDIEHWGEAAVGESRAGLGRLYVFQHRYVEAEAELHKALAASGSAVIVALVLTDLADLYRLQRRYDESEPLFARALHDRERIRGPGHPEVADTLVGLGQLFAAQGRNQDAAAALARSLEIRRAVFGEQHRFTTEANALLREVTAKTKGPRRL